MSRKIWSLEKYSKYEGAAWISITETESQKLSFIIENSHCIVAFGSTAQESFSLTLSESCIKGLAKDKSLAIGMWFMNQGTKFRVMFKNTEDIQSCVTELRRFFMITEAQELKTNEIPASELLRKIMNKDEPSLPGPESIPDCYPLESAIQLCILDPGFKSFVEKVGNIIEKIVDQDIH